MRRPRCITAHRLAGLLLIVPLSLTSLSTRAQEATPAGYRRHVDEALSAYSEGRFGDALQSFRAAHAVRPSARTHRGIGISAVQLARFELARRHLQLALASDERPLTASVRARTLEALALAEAPLGRFTLMVGDEPWDGEATALWVDGQAARPGANGELWLEAGAHQLEGHRDGRVVARLDVRVQRGERGELRLVAVEPAPARAGEAVPGPGPEGLPPPARSPPPTSAAHPMPHAAAAASASPTGPWWLAGAGAVALVAAGTAGLFATREYGKLDGECPAGACDPSLEEHRTRGEALKLVTNLLLAAGAGALGGAVVWWALLPAERSSTAQARPVVAPGYIGIRARGTL